MITAGEHDILIGGAGPVGLALAAMLVRHGAAPQRIALIDARSLEQAVKDPRSLALSWGSRQLLEEIRAWPAGATPIREIHVSRRGHFGRTLIAANEFALPELGYVSRYGALVQALSAAVSAAGVHVLRPMLIASREETADGISLLLADGRTLRGQVMVQAEGGLFEDQPGKPISRDYNQTAQVYNTTLRTFPSVLWAKTLYSGQKPAQLFQATATAQSAPNVDFSAPPAPTVNTGPTPAPAQ